METPEYTKDVSIMGHILQIMPSISGYLTLKKLFKLEKLLIKYNNTIFYIVGDDAGNFKLYTQHDIDTVIPKGIDIRDMIFSGSCKLKHNHNCNIDMYFDIMIRYDNFKIIDGDFGCFNKRSML